jgi:hypothetical protein
MLFDAGWTDAVRKLCMRPGCNVQFEALPFVLLGSDPRTSVLRSREGKSIEAGVYSYC